MREFPDLPTDLILFCRLLGDLQRDIHQNNRAKGFYDDLNPEDPRHVVSLWALIITEAVEGIEAIRRDPDAPCDKPILLTCEEEEWADTFIRLLDYAEARGIDAGRVAFAKHAYNKTRSLRHGGRRC